VLVRAHAFERAVQQVEAGVPVDGRERQWRGRPETERRATEVALGTSRSSGAITVIRVSWPVSARSAATASTAATPPPAITM